MGIESEFLPTITADIAFTDRLHLLHAAADLPGKLEMKNSCNIYASRRLNPPGR
jgi:hypothetical protein